MRPQVAATWSLAFVAGCSGVPKYRMAGPCEPAALFAQEACRAPAITASHRAGNLEARGQLVLPPSGAAEYVVVIIGGGLIGHTAFATDIWRGMCARFNCALLHFDVDLQPPAAVVVNDPGRNAALGSGDALIAILDSLAKTTGHAELERVKLALFGFSATGSFALTFAARHPDRTLTAIKYHSHLRGLDVDTAGLGTIPTLVIASTGDKSAGVDDAQALWQRERRDGAPWALALERERAHVSLDSWFEASDLIWHWIEALQKASKARVPTERMLRDGWLGDPSTERIGPASRFTGLQSTASWFPDSASAVAWRRLTRK